MIEFLKFLSDLGQTAIVLLAILIMAEEISRQAAKGWYESQSKYMKLTTSWDDSFFEGLVRAFKK